MRREKPLMFIQSPFIRKHRYTPVVEEESTSVFELEHSREAQQAEPSPILEVQEETSVNPHIRKNLEYLHHPFRKELYQPIEIVTGSSITKGKLHDLEKDIVWIKSNETLISVPVDEILDIRWKQQSFTI